MNAIALLRVSSDAQDNARQRADIAHCEKKFGITIVETVELEGVSGRHVLRNPEFLAILDKLRTREDIHGLCLSAIDRFFRTNKFGDLRILDSLGDHGKKIWSKKENEVDPATDEGFDTCMTAALKSGAEWREFRRRTMGGKEEKRLQGRHPGSPKLLPRGVVFDHKSGLWSYEEPHVSRIGRACTLVFEGMSYYSVAQEIGGGWTAAGIKKALQNPLWMGIRRYPPTTGERKEPLEKRVIPQEKALMSRETWEALQAIIDGRNTNWKMTKRPPRFLLAGLLRCSCGKRHYVQAKWKNGPAWQKEYYVCSSGRGGQKCGARAHSRESVEATVERIVTDKLLDPKFLLRVLEKANKPTEPKADPKKIEHELAKLEAKRERIRDNADEGVYDAAEAKRRLAAVDVEARELRALLPASPPTVDARRLVEALAAAFAEFAMLPFEDKRSILQRGFREFVIEAGGISSATLNGGFLGGATTIKVQTHRGSETGSSAP